MKLISFVIPSYNSEDYLHRAIDSLIIGGEDIEIIIVNDGSKDNTLKIANSYKKKYPKIVKVIDKENGGHGSTINEGLKIAEGLYFKVIDSDDWVCQDSLMKIISKLKEHVNSKTNVDLYITNFVYEHIEDNTSYERDYSDNYPNEIVFNWAQVKKRLRYSKTLLMHALIYKTSVLKESGLELPKHTFYVDNLFAYIPLPYAKSIYYMKLPFYRYLIGRIGQSVSLGNIVGRYKQQIKVQELMVSAYSYDLIKSYPKGLKNYMFHCLSAIMIITQMFTSGMYSKERKSDLKSLWKYIKTTDKKLYRFLRYRSVNVWVNFLPFKIRGYVMIKGYRILAKKIKLG